MCDSCSRMEDVTWGLASSIEALVRVPSWNSRCSFSCVVISSYAPLEASTPHFLSFNVASSRRNAPIADGIAERDAKHDERRVRGGKLGPQTRHVTCHCFVGDRTGDLGSVSGRRRPPLPVSVRLRADRQGLRPRWVDKPATDFAVTML